MNVDGPGDEEEEAEDEKGREREKKGKGPVRDGWTVLEGDGRCEACRQLKVGCRVSLDAIEKWRATHASGKRHARAPHNTSCEKCSQELKKPCILPATEDLRKEVEEEKRKRKGEKKETEKKTENKKRKELAGSEAPTQATETRKRSRMELEVVMPPARKTKAEVMEIEEFRRKQLELLEEIRESSESHNRWLRKVFNEMVATRKAAELQTQVLHRWVAAQEGGKAAVGGWVWKFDESDEEDSDFEAEEDEEEEE
jgi:hypothetical protein